MSRRPKPRLPVEPVIVSIESLSHEGRGVAHVDGKTLFVDGALPGERVRAQYTGRHRRYDEGRCVEVLQASPDRVPARCAHFGICGGCSLQHMETMAQLDFKQAALLEHLAHIGKVTPDAVLPPLTGPLWGYRHKARLGVKFVRKKGRLLVGFREKASPFLADLTRCEVLHESVGARLADLATLIGGLAAFDRIAQIEVAVSDTVTALVLRNLDPLDAADTEALCTFARDTGLHLYLQPGGPDTVTPLWPAAATTLSYAQPAHDVEIAFTPTDFTQVNVALNRAMVDLALDLLDLSANHRVLDLFCGLGNFTLPIARRVGEVVGVEGDAGLVARAAENARRNDIGNARFHAANLAEPDRGAPWQGQYDRVLLDPPRTGALEVLDSVTATGAGRVVYVSCQPTTLARDAGVLVQSHGYRLQAAGIMDMFPHTAHVESIAVFTRR